MPVQSTRSTLARNPEQPTDADAGDILSAFASPYCEPPPPRQRATSRDTAIVRAAVLRVRGIALTHAQAARAVANCLRRWGYTRLADEWDNAPNPARKMQDFIRRQYDAASIDRVPELVPNKFNAGRPLVLTKIKRPKRDAKPSAKNGNFRIVDKKLAWRVPKRKARPLSDADEAILVQLLEHAQPTTNYRDAIEYPAVLQRVIDVLAGGGKNSGPRFVARLVDAKRISAKPVIVREVVDSQLSKRRIPAWVIVAHDEGGKPERRLPGIRIAGVVAEVVPTERTGGAVRPPSGYNLSEQVGTTSAGHETVAVVPLHAVHGTLANGAEHAKRTPKGDPLWCSPGPAPTGAVVQVSTRRAGAPARSFLTASPAAADEDEDLEELAHRREVVKAIDRLKLQLLAIEIAPMPAEMWNAVALEVEDAVFDSASPSAAADGEIIFGYRRKFGVHNTSRPG